MLPRDGPSVKSPIEFISGKQNCQRLLICICTGTALYLLVTTHTTTAPKTETYVRLILAPDNPLLIVIFHIAARTPGQFLPCLEYSQPSKAYLVY